MIPSSDAPERISSGYHQDPFRAFMSPRNFPQMDMDILDFLNSSHPTVRKIREKMTFAEMNRLASSKSLSFKSVPKAAFLINRGNEASNSKKYEDALRYYSESVATAPIGTLELATAFANRSGVLFVRERYNLCLLDINRALSANVLPEHPEKVLLERKREAWSKLQALKTNHQTKAMEEKFKSGVQLRADERQLLYNSSMEMSIDDTDLKMDYESTDDPIWSTKLSNPTLPGASSKVLVVQNHHYPGWQLIATEDIEPGEVLFIREYLTVEVRKEERHTFCAYCTLWCEALIPCPTCSREMYCSESCREEAYNLYHRTECKILGLLNEKTKGELPNDVHTLRLFLTGTRQGAELGNLMNDPNVSGLMSGSFIQCFGIPNEYVHANNYYKYLATLNTLWKICRYDVNVTYRSEVLFDEVVWTVTALRKIKFFDNVGSAPPICKDCINDIEVFAALLLLQNARIRLTKCSFPVYVELYEKKADQPGVCRRKHIGDGISNELNLMNHSCDPNTGSLQNRRRSLIYSTRPILRGQQIYDFLAPFYTRNSLEERKEFLRAKERECICEACSNDWPLAKDVLAKENEYLTSDEWIIADIERLHKLFSSGFVDPNHDKPRERFADEVAPETLTCIKIIRQYVKEPSAASIICERLIRDHVRGKGNFYLL